MIELLFESDSATEKTEQENVRTLRVVMEMSQIDVLFVLFCEPQRNHHLVYNYATG